MRKILAFLISMLVIVSCTDPYDDSLIWNKLNELENGSANSGETNKIYYTASDGKKLFPNNTEPAVFGAILVSNIYENGVGVLTFDDDITSIGWYAFDGCSALTSITIPNSVTSIVDHAFYGCTGLTSITIPNSVTNIGWCAFSGCTGLTSITIPNSVTSIGSSAFGGCTGLTSITIPNSVTSIGISAFSGCSALTSVEFNATNCTSMGDSYYPVFKDCKSLSTVTIGENVKNIPAYAFYACSGLTSITIPNSVTSIGDNAFNGCSGLTSITIPNSVTSIGSYAFYGCNNLKEVINYSNLTIYKGESIFGYVGYYADKVINAPNGFVEGDFAWFENENGMTLAGYMGNATELIIPDEYKGNSVTNIGWCAFAYCSGLTSITIPNSVTSIEIGAFYECSGLTSITIPNSVTSIGSYAFDGCNNLKEVHVTDLDAWKNISFGYDANPLNNGAKLYLNGVEVTDY